MQLPEQTDTMLSQELTLLFCGRQDCPPGHAFGPAIREHWLLHYCVRGRGLFQAGGQTYALGAHEGFLILPDEVSYYEADCREPWSYLWFAFTGSRAAAYLARCGLGDKQRLFRCDDAASLCDCLEAAMQHHRLSYADEFHTQGILFHVFGLLAQAAALPYRDGSPSASFYVNKAVEYMQRNYQNNISIAQLAQYLSLNRSYLSELFQRQLHMSPREFLSRLRIGRAAELLRGSALPVSQVARSCGYEDPLAFSKAFHRIMEQSPSDYRAARLGDQLEESSRHIRTRPRLLK